MKGLSQLKKPIQNDQLHFNFTGLGIPFWPWVSTLKILRALNQSENITIQLTLESYGSISVSRQLPTYPSPNSTTVNWQQVKVNVGLGEG